MFNKIMVLVLGISMFGIIGCNIKTPEIRGVVLDEETKQPVEGAWVGASLELTTKTIGGDVHSALSIEKPHTRTDKHGRFIVLSKRFKKSYPPFGFGTEVLAFRVGVSTIDDKGGGVKYFGGYYRKDFGKGDGELQEVLRRDVIELTINIKPVERTESEYFHYLQSLYNYCLSGRFSVEVAPVEGGCDAWELNYAIVKHERFIKRLPELRTMDQRIHYVGAMKQLAYLYKQKGEFRKALNTFIEIRDFDKKRNMDLFLREYEHQINELQKLIREKQK
jgi:hypothetical protein